MNIKKLVMSALFLAIGLVLPFVTMQIPSIGNMLLPMHIPVLLCGFICGAPYGAIVGFIVPLLRSVLFSMPTMMPNAVAMAFELCTYGFVAGLLYHKFKSYKFGVYLTLIPTMIIGRVVWGIAAFCLFKAIGNTFTWAIFFAGAVVNAIPGIIIQIVLIPTIVIGLKKINAGVYDYETR